MFGALKPGFRSLATVKLVVNVVTVCRRTLNQKTQLRHRTVPLRQRGFLVLFHVANVDGVPLVHRVTTGTCNGGGSAEGRR